MKPEIHPEYKEIKVSCSCGNTFQTSSTLDHDLTIEICAKCHPFYTGTQKLIDTAGRVDRFRQKYGTSTKVAAKPTTSAPAVAVAVAKDVAATETADKKADND